MKKHIVKKSQTATEYLIILAIVVTIALIVVAAMGGIPGLKGAKTVEECFNNICSSYGFGEFVKFGDNPECEDCLIECVITKGSISHKEYLIITTPFNYTKCDWW